jgi:hypothetical protein
MRSTVLPKLPVAWCPLPWTSLAMAPPTVTKRVPGVTGTNHPSGRSHRMRSSRLVPPATVTTPSSASKARTPDSPVTSSTVPPAFWAGSP